MHDAHSNVTPKAHKRRGGRPKSKSPHDATIQLRLSQEQLTRVTLMAAQAKCSRSAIIRAGLEQVQLVMAAPRPEQLEQYRNLVKLSTNLNQLIKQAYIGRDVQHEALLALEQVRVLLWEIQQNGL